MKDHEGSHELHGFGSARLASRLSQNWASWIGGGGQGKE